MPSVTILQIWRGMMKMVCRDISLEWLSTTDLYHLAMDETTIQGVSILSTCAKGVKGSFTKNLVLDMALLRNQEADTEADAA